MYTCTINCIQLDLLHDSPLSVHATQKQSWLTQFVLLHKVLTVMHTWMINFGWAMRTELLTRDERATWHTGTHSLTHWNCCEITTAIWDNPSTCTWTLTIELSQTYCITHLQLSLLLESELDWLYLNYNSYCLQCQIWLTTSDRAKRAELPNSDTRARTTQAG